MVSKPDIIILEIVNLLSELSVFENYTFEQFLQKLIKLVNKVIKNDSCLVYIFDLDKGEFILIGSKKGKKDLLGNLKMKKGEGVTGWAADHQKTVVLAKEAYKDKRFKNFSELPEDRYEAFLSIPIVNKSGVTGVINIQNKKPYKFSKQEIKIMESLVKIIAAAFEKVVMTRKIDYLENKLEERKLVEKAKGLLMREKKISESQAYKLMQSESMKKRKAIKEIADAIILVFS